MKFGEQLLALGATLKEFIDGVLYGNVTSLNHSDQELHQGAEVLRFHLLVLPYQYHDDLGPMKFTVEALTIHKFLMGLGGLQDG